MDTEKGNNPCISFNSKNNLNQHHAACSFSISALKSHVHMVAVEVTKATIFYTHILYTVHISML